MESCKRLQLAAICSAKNVAPAQAGATVFLLEDCYQFFDWSTSLFFAIHGIIARSFSPTCSIW
jgi:hypothetical protein